MNKGLIYSAFLKGNSFRHCFISFPHHWRAFISPASISTFLLTSKTNSIIVSWAGHTHDQDREEVFVCASFKLLHANGFSDGEEIMVQQIPCPSPCSEATAVVIRDCDWEELILNMEVAQNTFLTQFRIIKKDQIFPLWLEGGTFIFLKVIECCPSPTISLLQPNTEVKILPPSEYVNNDVPLFLKPSVMKKETEIAHKTKDKNIFRLIYYIFILLGYNFNKLSVLPKEELYMQLKICLLPILLDQPLHVFSKLIVFHPSLVLVSEKNLRNTKYESSDYFIAMLHNVYPKNLDMTNTTSSPETFIVVVFVWEKLIKCIKSEPYFINIGNVLQYKTCILSRSLHKKVFVNKDTLILIETLESSFATSKASVVDVNIKDFNFINNQIVSSTLFSLFSEINQYCPIVINNNTVLNIIIEEIHGTLYLTTRDGNPIISKTAKDFTICFHDDKALKYYPKDDFIEEKQNSYFNFSSVHVNREVFNLLCSSIKKDLYLDNCSSPQFIFVQGTKGSGKTSIINKLMKEFSVYPYFVHCKLISFKILKGKKVESLQKLLKEAILNALMFKPSLLILDDLDCIPAMQSLENRGPLFEHLNHMACMIKSMLCQLNEILKITNRRNSFSPEGSVTVIATCRSRNDVHPFLSSPKGTNLFPRSFHIPSLSDEDKLSCLYCYLQNMRKTFIYKRNQLACEVSHENICNFEKDFLSKLSNITLPDLKNLALRIFIEAKKRWLFDTQFLENSTFLNKYSEYFYSFENSDLKKAYRGYISSSMREFCLQPKIERRKKIGGLHKPHQMLEEMIIWSSKYPEIFSETSLKIRSGILLYGPPGCGKTLLAKSFEDYHHVNFITIKGPELLSKYIGESEKAVRDAFERAANAKPCILFFDEFESIAPRRGHDNTGVTDRVVNQLLTQMDGVEGLSGVFVLAATSRPELIDPALLRPGRLDKGVYCPIPDLGEREEILRILCEDVNVDKTVTQNVREIALKTEGYSGADLQSILSTALIQASQASVGNFLYEAATEISLVNTSVQFQNDPKAEQISEHNDSDSSYLKRNTSNENLSASPCITMEHIVAALKEVNPSIGAKELQRYDELYQKFSQNKKGSSFAEVNPGKRETLA